MPARQIKHAQDAGAPKRGRDDDPDFEPSPTSSKKATKLPRGVMGMELDPTRRSARLAPKLAVAAEAKAAKEAKAVATKAAKAAKRTFEMTEATDVADADAPFTSTQPVRRRQKPPTATIVPPAGPIAPAAVARHLPTVAQVREMLERIDARRESPISPVQRPQASNMDDITKTLGALNFANKEDEFYLRKLKPLTRNPRAITRQQNLMRLFEEYVKLPLDDIASKIPTINAVYDILNSYETEDALFNNAPEVLKKLKRVQADASFMQYILDIDEDQYNSLESAYTKLKERVLHLYEMEMNPIRRKLSDATQKRLSHVAHAERSQNSPQKEKEHVYFAKYWDHRAENLQILLEEIIAEKNQFERLIKQYEPEYVIQDNMELDNPAPAPKTRATRSTVKEQAPQNIYELFALANLITTELKDKLAALKNKALEEKQKAAKAKTAAAPMGMDTSSPKSSPKTSPKRTTASADDLLMDLFGGLKL